MISDDYTFEIESGHSGIWTESPHSKYLKTVWVNEWPLGYIHKFESVGCIPQQLRRVPKDPLLRALVIAQTEEK